MELVSGRLLVCACHSNFQCLINVKATWETASSSLFPLTPTRWKQAWPCKHTHTHIHGSGWSCRDGDWHHATAGDVTSRTCAAKWNDMCLSMDEQLNVWHDPSPGCNGCLTEDLSSLNHMAALVFPGWTHTRSYVFCRTVHTNSPQHASEKTSIVVLRFPDFLYV